MGALDVACPKCGQGTKHKCIDWDTSVVPSRCVGVEPHDERVQAALAAAGGLLSSLDTLGARISLLEWKGGRTVLQVCLAVGALAFASELFDVPTCKALLREAETRAREKTRGKPGA